MVGRESETAAQARQQVAEMIALAERDVVDVMRSRTVEQEVLIGFVNDLPWVVVELKKPGVPARAAFDDNLTHYKQQIPALFWYNALLIASNGTNSRVALEVMLRGTCDRARLLDLVEHFTLFSEHRTGLVKILAQNHQYLGVNNAIASMLQARQRGHGRGGVFWQTQGSGKSFAMVFFAQKVLRTLPGSGVH